MATESAFKKSGAGSFIYILFLLLYCLVLFSDSVCIL